MTVTKPSYTLRPGDVITLRPRQNVLTLYRSVTEEVGASSLEWLSFETDTLRATLQGLPGPSDISLPVDVNVVVEFLSR